MHFCLPAFGSLTSLRLTSIDIDSLDPYSNQEYDSFRDVLMSLSSLNHLELQLDYFNPPTPRLPIVLPTVYFLHLDANKFPEHLSTIFCSVHAVSLVTLSLIIWEVMEESYLVGIHFPSLKHLILASITEDAPDFRRFARKFPDIKRLTFSTTVEHPYIISDFRYDSGYILAAVLHCASGGSGDEGSASNTGLRWHKLETIAVSTFDEHVDARTLQNAILDLQHAGHPMHKIMLPQTAFPWEDTDPVELRTIVEIEEFHVDWPTPFEQNI